jgi:hypothetical protein
MSNIHTARWADEITKSPQGACAMAMAEKRPFVLGLTFKVSVGDLIMFPDFFVSYPVIRFAKKSEVRAEGYPTNVVCQEPPEEKTEKVTEGVGETVGAGGGPRDKWGYGK